MLADTLPCLVLSKDTKVQETHEKVILEKKPKETRDWAEEQATESEADVR